MNVEFDFSKVSSYIENYKPLDELDKLRINSILEMYNSPIKYHINFDDYLSDTLNLTEVSNEEKLDNLFCLGVGALS